MQIVPMESENINRMMDAYTQTLTGSDAKRSAYTTQARKFVEWCIEAGRTPADPQTVTLYRNHLDDAGFKASTKALKVTAVRSFYTFLSSKGICGDFGQVISHPKLSRSPARSALSVAEARQLLSLWNGKDEESMRNKAILSMLIHTGCRCSELVGMSYHDLDKSNTIDGGTQASIHIKGKGRDDSNDFVIISDNCRRVLFEYLMIHRKGICGDDPIFTSVSRNAKGGRLDRCSVSRMVKKSLEAIGLSGDRYVCHSLRHTSADLACMVTDGNILATQIHLRHTTATMSERYVHSMMKASSTVTAGIDSVLDD